MTLRLSSAEAGQVLMLLDRRRVDELDADVCWELVRRGAVRLVVTDGGLAAVAEDGMVSVSDVMHVQDCERVRLAARGSRRRGECTCGSEPT